MAPSSASEASLSDESSLHGSTHLVRACGLQAPVSEQHSLLCVAITLVVRTCSLVLMLADCVRHQMQLGCCLLQGPAAGQPRSLVLFHVRSCPGHQLLQHERSLDGTTTTKAYTASGSFLRVPDFAGLAGLSSKKTVVAVGGRALKAALNFSAAG